MRLLVIVPTHEVRFRRSHPQRSKAMPALHFLLVLYAVLNVVMLLLIGEADFELHTVLPTLWLRSNITGHISKPRYLSIICQNSSSACSVHLPDTSCHDLNDVSLPVVNVDGLAAQLPVHPRNDFDALFLKVLVPLSDSFWP